MIFWEKERIFWDVIFLSWIVDLKFKFKNLEFKIINFYKSFNRYGKGRSKTGSIITTKRRNNRREKSPRTHFQSKPTNNQRHPSNKRSASPGNLPTTQPTPSFQPLLRIIHVEKNAKISQNGQGYRLQIC